jgi:hypothetical protein
VSTEPIAAAIERLHLLGVAAELASPARDRSQPQEGDQDPPVTMAVGRPPGPGRQEPDLTAVAAGAWTIEAVRRLGTTTDVPTAAKILGIGRTLAFRLVRADAFPVRIVRAGTRITVPVPEILRALGASVEAGGNP